MLGAWVTHSSVSPCVSLIVLVPKKKSKLCLCIDYCKLNTKTNINEAPMPPVEEIFEINKVP